MVSEGRQGGGHFIAGVFNKETSSTTSEFNDAQRCNVMPSQARTDRKRLNKRSFFAALKREVKAVFEESTGHIHISTSTTPKSTSTTPISTSRSTSTTISTSTSRDEIGASFEVNVISSKRR